MRFFRIILFMCTFFLVPFNALACSCGGTADRLSKIIGDDEIIFWGVPINPNVKDTSQPDELNLRTEFKVIEVFQGNLESNVQIEHKGSKPLSCGMSYLPETPTIVYAVRTKDGTYRSYYCMVSVLYQIADFNRMTYTDFEGAHKADISTYLNRGDNELNVSAVCRSRLSINHYPSTEDCRKQSGRIHQYERSLALRGMLREYFAHGKDARAINELCLIKIKQAYDAQVFTGRFEPDRECEYLVPYYDSIFRVRAD